jgi:hypothetical protein
MYLNTSIRGYPKGIRAGNDPRKPSIEVDDSFQHVTHCGIPYKLESVEVWGCGSPKNRYLLQIFILVIHLFLLYFSNFLVRDYKFFKYKIKCTFTNTSYNVYFIF